MKSRNGTEKSIAPTFSFPLKGEGTSLFLSLSFPSPLGGEGWGEREKEQI